MNSLAIPTQALVPALSPLMERALSECIDHRDGEGESALLIHARRHPSRHEIEAARALLAAIENPPTIGVRGLGAWLTPFRTLPGAPSADVFDAGVAVLLLAVGSLPAGVLTTEARAKASQKWKWWPTGADLFALLDPIASPWRIRMAELRSLIRRGEQSREPERRGAPTPDESDYVRARVREAVANLTRAE